MLETSAETAHNDAAEVAAFWQQLQTAVDATAYQPQRSDHIEAARLQTRNVPYYVIKEPSHKSYLRLSEADYAVWWQMDGARSIKDLIYYSFLRYQTLPIAHLTNLVSELRAGGFLQDNSTNLYDQIQAQLTERAPARRGRQLAQGFLNTEIAVNGLDPFFNLLHKLLGWLFWWPMQVVLLLIILVGGVRFGLLVVDNEFRLLSGGINLLTLVLANLTVITIHELAHGLAVKQFGRELNRGGMLIYWGFPAFFVDTRDTWLSPRLARMAVSWAGPHSGLLIGGLVGLFLPALFQPELPVTEQPLLIFLYQLGFLAYLTVVVNLNPLLELDGYFLLMDWLEMPGLRQRAIQFWRKSLWGKLRDNWLPTRFWPALSPTERIFTIFGGVAIVYSVYALGLAIYFWWTRVQPVMDGWWGSGPLGQLGVLLIWGLFVLPVLYYLLNLVWRRAWLTLNWLANRDLLARPDVLALLLGVPLLTLLLGGSLLLSNEQGWLLWVLLLHGLTAVFWLSVARQLPGSRFQWAIYSLTAVPTLLTLVWWLGRATLGTFLWFDLANLAAAIPVLAASIVAWFTVRPSRLSSTEQSGMVGVALLGVSTAVLLLSRLQAEAWPFASVVLTATFVGLLLMVPLLLNFFRSRFMLPWVILTLALLLQPWLIGFPRLHLLVLGLWLYAGLLYVLLGLLAEFRRYEEAVPETAVFSERERLVNAFEHFMRSLFLGYEAIFGGRRLADIQAQILSLGAIDPDMTILDVAERCRTALLLAVDRLDDVAGTPFTRQAGEAAYDSLPWLEAETLARHVLSKTDWGASLAQGFIVARDSRADIVRQADIFAGFDNEAVEAVVSVLRPWRGYAGGMIAEAGDDATHFFLVETGTVSVYKDGERVATLRRGAAFGNNALLASGAYERSYRAETAVYGYVLVREQFDPLLRADTTLARQVSEGAQERQLLRQMPLFSSLSPQELALLDARLTERQAEPNETLIAQGDPRSSLFIIASGQVEVVRDGKVVGQLGEGEHFGEYALFADTPYTATYRAVQPTRLLLLDEPKFDELVENYAQMEHYVEQLGSGRLVTLQRRMGITAVFS